MHGPGRGTDGCARLARIPIVASPVAHNDYDDEALDEDDIDDGGGPGWRQRLLSWGQALVGLGLGFLIPYTL